MGLTRPGLAVFSGEIDQRIRDTAFSNMPIGGGIFPGPNILMMKWQISEEEEALKNNNTHLSQKSQV
jgi:hypothetical protein